MCRKHYCEFDRVTAGAFCRGDLLANGKGKRKYFFSSINKSRDSYRTFDERTFSDRAYTLHTHAHMHTFFSLLSLSLSCIFFLDNILSLTFPRLSFCNPSIYFCLLCSHWNVLHLKFNGNSNQHNLIRIKRYFTFIYIYIYSFFISSYLNNLISIICICTPTMYINYVQNNDKA